MTLKKLFSRRWLLALAGLIQLPFWVLAAGPEAINFFKTPTASSPTLRRADSLFAQGQYAATLPLYQAQVWQQQRMSAQLVLRMAYAQHQLGHYAAEVLYLNLALARQPQMATWRQLVALAQRQRLVGYPATWQQEVRVRLQGYYYPGLQALLSAAVVLAVVGLLRRRSSRGQWLTYGGYLLAVGAYVLLLRPAPTGIVARPGVALMAGPSAGAPWLSTAAPGDRLPILGRQDIWLQVRWQERTAYVRTADTFVVE
ncbi:MAG: hypothetical protein ACRYFX_16675 [Janthinobacterium lividum]